MIARRLLLALFLIPLAPDVSSAQQGNQQLLEQFQDWAAYTANAGNGKICFAISQPTTRAPAGLNRGDGYLFVTHRPGDKVRNEVNVELGFPTQNGSTADISIGSNTFSMMTQDGRAWSNGDDDQRLVQAMRGGSTMTIRSTSGRGNVTTDTFSLRGVSAALDRINRECP